MTSFSQGGDAVPRIISWAVERDPIRAVLLTSTRAIPTSEIDALSDYDVILILQDIHPWVDDHSWLDDFGEVLITYWDAVYPNPDFGFEQCANVTQYTSGLKIDFTLWPVNLLQQIVAAPRLPAELDAGYRVLLDKDQLTDGILPPTGKAYVPTRPTLKDYQLMVNNFLSDAPFVAKCLWRDELMPAKWCLDYDMKHVYLRRMLEWSVEVDHAWSLPVKNLGKGFKKLLPSHIWSAMEQTYAGGGISDNWVALDLTMELFRQVAIDVGNHFGYAYPDTLHARVRGYVQQIRQMSKSGSQELMSGG